MINIIVCFLFLVFDVLKLILYAKKSIKNNIMKKNKEKQ